MPRISVEVNQDIFDKIEKIAEKQKTTVSHVLEDKIRHIAGNDYSDDFLNYSVQ